MHVVLELGQEELEKVVAEHVATLRGLDPDAITVQLVYRQVKKDQERAIVAKVAYDV